MKREKIVANLNTTIVKVKHYASGGNTCLNKPFKYNYC